MKLKLTILLISCAVVSNLMAETPKASWHGESISTSASQTYADIKQTLGIVPTFLKTYPTDSIAGAWQELKSIQISSDTALPPRYKELIGLAVASQIPCHYCTQFHTAFAKMNGATDAQATEAVALSACARHWGAYMNGMQVDETAFRQDVDRMMKKLRDDKNQTQHAGFELAVPLSTTDALRDIENTFGFVPTFFRNVPAVGLAGAWNNLKTLELNPTTSIPPKYKALIGLAVSAQIPCNHCVYFDTEGSKLSGASGQEINEAVAMAALTRQWSTVLNGNRTDESQFKKELAQIVDHAKRSAKTNT